jgi:hypothetical protein
MDPIRVYGAAAARSNSLATAPFGVGAPAHHAQPTGDTNQNVGGTAGIPASRAAGISSKIKLRPRLRGPSARGKSARLALRR